MEYWFKCSSNENAPAMKVDSLWEARDMRNHPDYYEVDETGLPVTNAEQGEPPRINFRTPQRKK
jgi:hypothetical protein